MPIICLVNKPIFAPISISIIFSKLDFFKAKCKKSKLCIPQQLSLSVVGQIHPSHLRNREDCFASPENNILLSTGPYSIVLIPLLARNKKYGWY